MVLNLFGFEKDIYVQCLVMFQASRAQMAKNIEIEKMLDDLNQVKKTK